MNMDNNDDENVLSQRSPMTVTVGFTETSGNTTDIELDPELFEIWLSGELAAAHRWTDKLWTDAPVSDEEWVKRYLLACCVPYHRIGTVNHLATERSIGWVAIRAASL